MNPIDCVPLSPDRLADDLAFFETRAFTDNPRWSGCYCSIPIHDPQKIEWRTRTGSENRASIIECICSGRTGGFLAYRDGEVIGWCNARPWSMYLDAGFEVVRETEDGDVFVRKSLAWRRRRCASRRFRSRDGRRAVIAAAWRIRARTLRP